jgi:hypothetical protein
MNSVCNVPSVRKGNFVTVNVPVKQYGTFSDSKTLPADTVYQVTYVSRNNPNLIRIYGGNMVGSRTINASDATVVPGPQCSVKVGDMFSSHWGYDQTNVDFYMVVKVTGKSAWLASMDKTRTYDGTMSGTCRPVLKQPIELGNGKQHRIKTTADGKVCFRLTSYSIAFPYDGGDCFFSEWH